MAYWTNFMYIPQTLYFLSRLRRSSSNYYNIENLIPVLRLGSEILLFGGSNRKESADTLSSLQYSARNG